MYLPHPTALLQTVYYLYQQALTAINDLIHTLHGFLPGHPLG